MFSDNELRLYGLRVLHYVSKALTGMPIYGVWSGDYLQEVQQSQYDMWQLR